MASTNAVGSSALEALLHDRAALALLDVELAQASEAHDSHRRALKQAQYALDHSSLRLTQLTARRDALQKDMWEARQLQSPISALPDEVLSEVFGQAHPLTAFDCVLEIDWDLVKLPGRLCAVSRRWNSIASRTYTLWSYIGLSTDEHDPQYVDGGLLVYLKRVLQRSRRSHLDVIVDALDSVTGTARPKAVPLGRRRLFRSLFEMLLPEIGRIRSLHIAGSFYGRLPGDNNHEDLRDLVVGFLRFPTPALEEVRLEFDLGTDPDGYNKMWEPYAARPLPLYFPNAPRLERLALEYVPIMCCGPAHPGLPSLKELRIQNDTLLHAHLLAMLAVCPSLDELDLEVEDGLPIPDVDDQVLPLSVSIKSLVMDLGIDSDVFNGNIQFPRLTALSIPNYSADATFLLHIAGSLTSLTLPHARVEEEDFAKYAVLRNLEHFTVEDAETFDQVAFVAAITRATDPMWPRLRSLRMFIMKTADNLWHNVWQCKELTLAVLHVNSHIASKLGGARPCKVTHLCGEKLAACVNQAYRKLTTRRNPATSMS